MREYAITVICTLAITVLGSALAYRQDDKSTSMAFSLIVICAVVLPLAPAVSELFSEHSIPDFSTGEVGAEYEITAKEALEEGIENAIIQRFDADADGVFVEIYGFDFSDMSCERIEVTLRGTAALINFDALKKYLQSSFNECEVYVEIG